MRSYLLLIVLSVFATAANGQNLPRSFDNFDRSQGVQIYLPPAPVLVKKAVKTKRGIKWVVAVEDKLVKKTTQTAPAAYKAAPSAGRYGVYGGLTLAMGSSSGLKGFTTGNPAHDSFIVDSSRRYNVDPLLIYSQMHQESSFNLRATSPKGASGLMQLMPGTARRFGVTRIYDPQQNIDAGVKYMRWLLDTFNGDVVLALAGYNAGEGAVMKYGWQVPPYRETQEYVRRITARYNSISNPQFLRSAPRVSSAVAARLEQNISRPLNVYEPDPLTIRLPDGKMILVNQ